MIQTMKIQKLLELSLFALLVATSALWLSIGNASDTSKYYPQTKNWAFVDSRVNLSQFVFHDRNVNGVYDLGDIAMSQIRIELHRLLEDDTYEKVSHSKTNGNGFANFRTWLNKPNTTINTPGQYRFSIIVPPAWRVTTGATSQTVTISERLYTHSQLFLEDYLKPIGVAPVLAIIGTSNQSGEVRVSDVQGNEVAVQEVAAGQAYRFELDAGEYTVANGATATQVELSNLPVNIGQLENRSELGGLFGGKARTATFDDLPKHGLYKIPVGYQRLAWADINSIRRDFSSGTNQGYVNGVISGNYVAYTSQARHGEILSSVPFDFDSVYLSVAWRQAEGQEVLIEMWRGDEKVVSDRFRLSILGPIKYEPKVKDVTRVRIAPINGWQIVLDDLTIVRCENWWCRF